MEPVQSSKHSKPPTIDELVARARALQPALQKAARDTESRGRVSETTMEQLAQADLLRLVKPKRFGGFEYGPSAMTRVGFELGRACGSTAWCALIANCNAWFASYWSLEAQEEVWGEEPGNLIAATLVPTGQCESVDGGVNIWGRWPFASNCDNSQWHVVSAMLPSAQGAPSGVGWFLTPASTLSIDHESWRVSGLQGTGSKTLVAEKPVFIPAHRIVRFDDIQAGKAPGLSIPDNVMARFAFLTFGASSLVPQLLGMAQGSLDWFCEAMREKKRITMRPGAAPSVADSPLIQERAGRASAAIDAALGFMLTELTAAEEVIFAGNALSVDQRLRVRRALGFGARQAVDAASLLFEGAGASSTDLNSPLQRHWRDINAGARHVSLDVQGINVLFGQRLFGMTPMGGF